MLSHVRHSVAHALPASCSASVWWLRRRDRPPPDPAVAPHAQQRRQPPDNHGRRAGDEYVLGRDIPRRDLGCRRNRTLDPLATHNGMAGDQQSCVHRLAAGRLGTLQSRRGTRRPPHPGDPPCPRDQEPDHLGSRFPRVRRAARDRRLGARAPPSDRFRRLPTGVEGHPESPHRSSSSSSTETASGACSASARNSVRCFTPSNTMRTPEASTSSEPSSRTSMSQLRACPPLPTAELMVTPASASVPRPRVRCPLWELPRRRRRAEPLALGRVI